MAIEALNTKLDTMQDHVDLLVKNYHLSQQNNAALKDEIKMLRTQLHVVQKRNQKTHTQVQSMIKRIREEIYD
jgi:hypothetical protein